MSKEFNFTRGSLILYLDLILLFGGKRVSSSYVQKAPIAITALKRTSADFNSLECITDYNL